VEERSAWISYTIESELLMNQISNEQTDFGTGGRCQAIFPMDRALFDVANVHELLRSTLVMFADRFGKDSSKHTGAITWSRIRPIAARIPCFPGDLNQVWDQHHRQRAGGDAREGRHTDRPHRQGGEKLARIEICYPGPVSPMRRASTSSSPSSPPKPVGEGTGLGLDLAWNIVVKKHRGDLRVESCRAIPASSCCCRWKRPRVEEFGDPDLDAEMTE